MRRRLTPGFVLLRAAGFGALALLLWNPTTSRWEPGGVPPLVLLDASLSMSGRGGRWREALDSARALARGGGGGVIWRFGAEVRAFDSLPPADGTSRLAPALAAVAARGGPVIVVTDGAIDDLADVPTDLLRRPRVVVLPRSSFPDAFVAAVEGPRRVGASDTVRLAVSFGTAGTRAGGRGMGKGTLAVSLGDQRLVAREVTLRDSGTVSTEISLPASRLPSGWSALHVRLEGVRADSEPRDDARVFLLEVSPQPAVVLLASPPDWDTRFLARTLSDVARVPVKAFVEAEPGGSRWRDATTMAHIPLSEVTGAVAGAQLVVQAGDPAGFARFAPKGAVLSWPTARGQEGDWYVQAPLSSPLAAGLAGVAWDALPPAPSLADLRRDSSAVVVLTARLARRGAPRPLVFLAEEEGRRHATIAAAGLYRWAFRGGTSGEAYRALIAALADWLLQEGGAIRERAVPEVREVPNGRPLLWRWSDPGAPRDLVLALSGAGRARVDTLRFNAAGRAELELPPGVYQYAIQGGRESGLVAVDTYSDEWRPVGRALRAQPGIPAGRLATVTLRDRWWLFVVAIAAFGAEWAWRRRQGLP